MTVSGTDIKPRLPDDLTGLPPQMAALFATLDLTLQADIAAAIRLIDYDLGDDILSYHPQSDGSYVSTIHANATQANATQANATQANATHSHQPANSDPVFGILCQGRARILIDNTQKEVTAEALTIDKCFGGDGYLVDRPFAYRVIAASSSLSRVAVVPSSLMQKAFEASVQLKQYCLKQAQTRERLIFFRLLTALRSHPSHQLAQWMPYLEEITVEAGASLAEKTSPESGRYWLRTGVVVSRSGMSPPQLGDSWGYSTGEISRNKVVRNEISKNEASKKETSESKISKNEISEREPESQTNEEPPSEQPYHDWIAKSDLILYRLPVAAWTIAKAFTADLDTAKGWDSPSDRMFREQLQAQISIDADRLAQQHAQHGSRPAAYEKKAARVQQSSSPDKHTPLKVDNTATEIIFPKPPKRIILDKLRRYPWIAQQSSSDCGAACLSMCARYWGQRFPLHVLRERANVGRAGASLKGLARAAEEIGFQARPVRASIGALANQKNPWIAHWEGIHYVVVYRTNAQKVIIADPAEGRRTISRKHFCEKWTGFGLLLSPTEQLKETEIKQTSLGRYVKALLPYRALIAQIIALSFLIQCFSLVTPLFTQVILDKVVVQKSLSTLNVFALGLLIFGLWSLMMSAARQYLLSYFSNRLDLTLISGFIRHVMSLPIRFFESRRVGDILTRVQENQKIQQFLIGQVVLAWLNLLTGFVYLALMLYYNWKLTLLVLMMVPPIVIITLGSTPFLRRISREVFKEAANQNSALVEMVSGISTVKSTATEQEMRWRWEETLTRQMNARFKGQKLGISLQSLSGGINSIGGTLLLWYGATLVIQGQLSIGQFVAFNMMIGYVISPVVALAGLWDELQEVLISVERLNDVFESPVESAKGGMVIPPLRGEVTFEDVTFRYSEEDERNTLQNISFSVSAGTTIAIVGRSGSGKSTLVKLLEGLYLPRQGRILIDGHDIAHIEPISLRSQLGVVPQDCFLFSGTILENITLFRDNISLDAAITAAKLAEAHAFIQALPMGYRTKVGERGATLSGGQRQRIAIARALIGEPKILLLDEATSSLDTESERQFQQNLERISQACTTFIIAHRLSTVRNADCILVLDRGVIAEQGTHEQLVAEKGLYYSLAQQQLEL